MEHSKFQFKNFSIIRSLIERKGNESSKKLSISFNPRGLILKEQSTFQLQMGVKIGDKSESINIEIDALANFIFEDSSALEELNHYFYLNAPALLFPYIRAYIATLTNLSGLGAINLPTLNMSQIGENLRENTKLK